MDREQFVVLYLNMKLHPIGVEIIAIGGSYACNVEIKNVFKGAIVANAVAIAVAHNHPSGVPKPSEGDFALTRQIAWAGEILGIRLIDHVIIGEDTFYSMKRKPRRIVDRHRIRSGRNGCVKQTAENRKVVNNCEA